MFKFIPYDLLNWKLKRILLLIQFDQYDIFNL